MQSSADPAGFFGRTSAQRERANAHAAASIVNFMTPPAARALKALPAVKRLGDPRLPEARLGTSCHDMAALPRPAVTCLGRPRPGDLAAPVQATPALDVAAPSGPDQGSHPCL